MIWLYLFGLYFFCSWAWIATGLYAHQQGKNLVPGGKEGGEMAFSLFIGAVYSFFPVIGHVYLWFDCSGFKYGHDFPSYWKVKGLLEPTDPRNPDNDLSAAERRGRKKGGAKPKKPDSLPSVDSTPPPPTSGGLTDSIAEAERKIEQVTEKVMRMEEKARRRREEHIDTRTKDPS